MPRYIYECSKCDGQFKTVHGMNEEQTHCEVCFSHVSELKRIPQMTYSPKADTDSAKRVKQAIKDNREILKQASKEAKGNTHDG